MPAGINLLGAEIHALNLSGCHVGRISADGMQVEAGMYLRAGFKATGRVRLAGAEIGGNLDCDGGQFINPGSEALAADGMKVRGSISLGAGFRAEGQVRLPGAAVGGSVNCDGGDTAEPRQRRVAGRPFESRRQRFLRRWISRRREGGIARSRRSPVISSGTASAGRSRPRSTCVQPKSARCGWSVPVGPASGKLLLHGLTYDEMDERAAG